MVIHRFRANYWSCSAFADWIRKTFGKYEKPDAATLEEWAEWKTMSKTRHKFVHWFTEEFLDSVQNTIMFIPDVWNTIRAYLRNRFVDKTHYLETKLPPGEFYEFDTKILHGLFEELVDFVECEKAWMHVVFSDDAKEKYKFPFWQRVRMFRFGYFRCPQAGLDHLQWEISLKYDDEWMPKDSPNYGQPTHQAIAAKEQLELYNWWKNVRPQRPDPYEHIDEDEAKRERWERVHQIEEQYDKEDEEMLIRLIKIRRSLWT